METKCDFILAEWEGQNNYTKKNFKLKKSVQHKTKAATAAFVQLTQWRQFYCSLSAINQIRELPPLHELVL